MTPQMLDILRRYESEFVWLDPRCGRYRWACRDSGDNVAWANKDAVECCLAEGLIEVGYLARLTAKGKAVLAVQGQERSNT